MPYCFTLFFILMAVMLPSAAAQNALGFRLGLNVAGVAGGLASSGTWGTRTGFVAGVYGTIPLRYSLVVQPELLYTQKGFTTDRAMLNNPSGDVDSEVFPASFESTYLETPLLLKYVFSFDRTTSIGIYVGPTIGFELSERIIVDDLQGSQEIDLLKSTDVGAALGGDVQITLAGFETMFGLRFTRSISNMLNDDVLSSERALYNSVYSFLVGVQL